MIILCTKSKGKKQKEFLEQLKQKRAKEPYPNVLSVVEFKEVLVTSSVHQPELYWGYEN